MATPKVAPARLSLQRSICKPLILSPEEMAAARRHRHEFWRKVYGIQKIQTQETR